MYLIERLSEFYKKLKGEKSIPFFNAQETTVIVNGIEWATVNVGTDKDHPYGKLYTLQEALQLQNDIWRLPTKEEAYSLKPFVRTFNEPSEIRGSWITEGKQKIFFPWNFIRRRERFLPRDIGAYWTSSISNEDLQFYYLFEVAGYFCLAPQGYSPFKVGIRFVRRN